MVFQPRIAINFLALASFLASIAAMMRGNFVYPVELFLTLIIGVLLVATITFANDDAPGAFISAIFFLAIVANIAYMYSVSGYLSTARIGTLALAVSGLALSLIELVAQPVPAELSTEAKNLLAAEKRISAARHRLESIKEAAPSQKARKTRKSKPRKKR